MYREQYGEYASWVMYREQYGEYALTQTRL